MPRMGGRSYSGKEPETEEFQTDLKYGNVRSNRMSGDENDDNGNVSESDDQLSDLSADEHSDEEGDDVADESSDEDAPPQSVSFAKSKESALEKIRDAMKQINDEERHKKEKRRLLNQKNIESKRRKLDALAKARLSDEILAEIPSKIEKVPRVSGEERLGNLDCSRGGHSPSGSDVEEEVEISEDFIPLGYDRFSGIAVMTEKQASSKKMSLAQSAQEFRQKSLYSNRIQRESTKQKISKQLKRKARFL
ncbi:uncharacterized protein LOC135475508 [Liolophura sinensis]|uniref:uncharacterized protein LOC135475508 n=1 Tax=Liolophura sinensis TaxID=3198878 RepID=UPI0031593BB8